MKALVVADEDGDLYVELPNDFGEKIAKDWQEGDILQIKKGENSFTLVNDTLISRTTTTDAHLLDGDSDVMPINIEDVNIA
jgi:hypothetical protein